MKKMLEPIKIKNIELKNRIVFPPLTTGYEEKGMITEKSINFYTSLAKGGVGLIILGDLSTVKAMSPIPMLFDDMFIPGLKKLTDSVHALGAKISGQIFHPEYSPEALMKAMQTGGREVAMKLLHDSLENFCNTITIDEIHAIQDKFVETAIRAEKAGFDMIQVHGDRIIGMFSSPILNKRTDIYGGTLENRARFALEIVEKIRKALPDMPIDYKLAIIRMNPRMGKGGPTLEEAKIMSQWLVEKGVDTFHVCLANHGSINDTIPGMGEQPYACFLDLAEEIKKSVNVPITTVGRIIKPQMVEEIISEGKADMVAMGRQLVCDPDWVLKVINNKEDDIRYCVMCNRGCTANLLARQPVSCAINAANGREYCPEIKEAETKKNIIIIGGGPAGLEAARVLSLRGHKVTIYEKESILGGQLNLADVPPEKDELSRIKDYLIKQVDKLGVNIIINKNVDINMIKGINADEIIIATGAIPVKANIKGNDNKNVLNPWDVLSEVKSVGDDIVIIGGGTVAVETAKFLANKGKNITMVIRSDVFGKGEIPSVIPRHKKYLEERNCKILLKHTPVEIKDNEIIVKTSSENVISIKCDNVILATGSKPNKALQEILDIDNINNNIYYIGDCAKGNARLLSDAIREGFELGISL